MAILIALGWLGSVLKTNLFWLYLLQLKEYRIDRLRDHLETEKGRSLVFNKLLGAKLAIFFALAIAHITQARETGGASLLLLGLLAVYGAEIYSAYKKFRSGSLKQPVRTSKALMLIALASAIQLAFLALALSSSADSSRFATYLLAFDILSPAIVTGLILSLKPLNFFLKARLFRQAQKRREELKDLLVIGITGSYGKTSTKEILSAILETRFRVFKTKEHENTEVAIAKAVVNDLKEEHEIFICEMGAYRAGEIKLISGVVKPKMGVFIGANEQHLSLFGSMEHLLAGEGGGELLAALPKGSLGIFNGNNPYAAELYQKAEIAKRICYAEAGSNVHAKKDVWAANIKVKSDSLAFTVFTNKNRSGEEFETHFLGAHNVENILLAVAVAEELGMTLEEIATAVAKLKPMARTVSHSKGKWGLHLIDSTYSANPTGVYSHIDYLKSWHGVKKFFIMPCLIELGPKSKEIHREIGRRLGEEADTVIVTTAERFDDIKIGFFESAKAKQSKKRILHSENPAEIAKIIKDESKSGDVVFLEGRLPEELIRLLKK